MSENELPQLSYTRLARFFAFQVVLFIVVGILCLSVGTKYSVGLFVAGALIIGLGLLNIAGSVMAGREAMRSYSQIHRPNQQYHNTVKSILETERPYKGTLRMFQTGIIPLLAGLVLSLLVG